MSLRDALAGVKQSQTDQDQVRPDDVIAANIQAPRHKTLSAKKPPVGSRVSGKSSNPDFEKVGVYVRTETRRKAERKWEDHAGGDLSDLIETLLSQYIRD
jgi:hypothetical protein